MPKKVKSRGVSDADTPLTPITAKERRKIRKSIKKKYDGFRKRYPGVHGKVVDFITHSIEDGTLYFSLRFKDDKADSEVETPSVGETGLKACC